VVGAVVDDVVVVAAVDGVALRDGSEAGVVSVLDRVVMVGVVVVGVVVVVVVGSGSVADSAAELEHDAIAVTARVSIAPRRDRPITPCTL